MRTAAMSRECTITIGLEDCGLILLGMGSIIDTDMQVSEGGQMALARLLQLLGGAVLEAAHKQ